MNTDMQFIIRYGTEDTVENSGGVSEVTTH